MKIESLTPLLLIAAACATAPAPPEVAPAELNRYLVDPRTAQSEPVARGVARRFQSAWQAYQAGRLQEAERLYTEILGPEPDYAPAVLGLAAIALTRGDFDRAEKQIERAETLWPDSSLGRMYRAELLRARGDLQAAYSLYREIAGSVSPPASAKERFEEIRGVLFNQLFSHATALSDHDAAIAVLREALEVEPSSSAARRLLSRRLIETGRFDEAQRELEPLLTTGQAEDIEGQQLMAEIEVGTGRYQEAIARYARLVRQSDDAALRQRLEQIKQAWTEANMPPQQRRALEAGAVTRADLAVLIYWNVPDVRFAQNLPQPPIAIDIAEVNGREELIRALSFRFFPVDPLTRRVEPYRLVTAGSLLRILARIATLRGVLVCAAEASREPNEAERAVRILEACGVPVRDLTADPEGFVTGRTAEQALTQIATLLKSAEQRQARQ